MSGLRAVVLLALCLALQHGLGRLAPPAVRYVDLLWIPVVASAVAGSPRAAMLVGCAGGLLQDAWFHAGVFGLNGFSKTLLGWLAGVLGTRIDLRPFYGRFSTGALLAIGGGFLDYGLRRLLALESPVPDPLALAIGGLANGLLAAFALLIMDRVGTRRRTAYRGS